ncbi:hypothetical protein V9T40_000525 [Parthenolecanium corni]|uniref:Uncharacterized protein n=1 Tax=Parthenolecanium corni TaxID=536013 RepID=A0AAN9Y0G7_9HEMI
MLIDRVVLGKGTSNTGNGARKFFRHHETVSRITEVDHECIKRLYFVMVALTCGKQLNIATLQKFCQETAELFVQRYPWYRMPVKVHKLLVHSVQVTEYLPVPIGIMSEEALEAANKIYRRVRERHTTEKKTIQDLLCYMLAFSDPKLSTLKRPAKDSLDLPQEVLSLLVPQIPVDTEQMLPPNDVDLNIEVDVAYAVENFHD